MRVFLTLLLLCVCCLSSAQKIKTVKGEYTYYVPDDMTLNLAMQEALRRAQIEAIANEFGTSISMNSFFVQSERSEDFYQEGMSLVNGEWLETIGEPEFERGFHGEDLYIKCTIKGKAREIVKSSIELEFMVLCNNPNDRSEKTDFVSGDKIYLSFRSPRDGYLAVFLHDNKTNEVSCLLPYKRDNVPAVKVEQDTRYVFFSKKDNTLNLRTQEYVMGCSGGHDTNTLYIVFSKNEFSKPMLENDGGKTVLKHLDFETFIAWLSKAQAQDRDMIVEKKMLSISEK